MQTLIGDFGEPLTCLAIDIVQIGEGAQRPEVLANVADAAALHFSFLPTRGRIAGAWNEAELTREGEEARLKPHQPPIVFGDGGGQVVVPDLAADAAQELEGMNVAANESLKALAMGELQVQHPAVALHQGEGVKLALVAGVIERAEVTPIDFEAFPGDRLHAHKCARRWLGPDLADILAQNRVAAIVAHCAETLLDHSGTHGGVLCQQIGNGVLERIKLAGSDTGNRRPVRLLKVFLDGAPAHAQVAFDLADRPALRVVELMESLDLFVGEHQAFLFFQARASARPEGCCLQEDSEAGSLRGGPATIKTCAAAKLLLARSSAPGPNSQTPATEDFRSRAELLLARWSRRWRWSRWRCRLRFRSADCGCAA